MVRLFADETNVNVKISSSRDGKVTQLEIRLRTLSLIRCSPWRGGWEGEGGYFPQIWGRSGMAPNLESGRGIRGK